MHRAFPLLIYLYKRLTTLINVVFNKKLYKYRIENDNELLLYRVRIEKIMIVKGNTKERLLQIIDSGVSLVDPNDKHINYLIQNDVLLQEE